MAIDEYITEYEKLFPHLDFDTNTGWGYLPPSEPIMDMCSYIKDEVSPQNMLEIGYYAGHSTSYFAHYLPDCNIISCCPNHPLYRQTVLGVERKYPNVKVIGNKSPELWEHILDWTPFDFVFIDGNHASRAVELDTQLAFTVGAKYILFDNYDQDSVKHGVRYFRPLMKHIKTWDYYAENKFKTKLNSISLYKTLDK